MPKEAFYKIKPEKQQIILNVAKNEFGINGIENTSINEIIAKSKISRGSFYQYFQDKDDLYNYLIQTLQNDLVSTFVDAMSNKLTIFESGMLLFDKFIEYFHHENEAFLRQLALNFTPRKIMDFVEHFDKINPLIFTKVADFKKLDVNSPDDFQVLIESIITYVVEKGIEVYTGYGSEKNCRYMINLFFERLKKAYYKK